MARPAVLRLRPRKFLRGDVIISPRCFSDGPADHSTRSYFGCPTKNKKDHMWFTWYLYIYILPDWAVTLIIVWLHSVEPNIFAIAVIKYIYYFQERKNRLEQSRFNVDNVQRRIVIHQPFEDASRALHEYHATQKFAERRA